MTQGEAEAGRCVPAELLAKALENRRRQLAELERPDGGTRVHMKRPVARGSRGPGVARHLDTHDLRPGGHDPRHRAGPVEAAELALDVLPDPLHHRRRACPGSTAITRA